ncbi:hypothetical protein D3C80_1964470 [compost metagenome]
MKFNKRQPSMTSCDINNQGVSSWNSSLIVQMSNQSEVFREHVHIPSVSEYSKESATVG